MQSCTLYFKKLIANLTIYLIINTKMWRENVQLFLGKF